MGKRFFVRTRGDKGTGTERGRVIDGPNGNVFPFALAGNSLTNAAEKTPVTTARLFDTAGKDKRKLSRLRQRNTNVRKIRTDGYSEVVRRRWYVKGGNIKDYKSRDSGDCMARDVRLFSYKRYRVFLRYENIVLRINERPPSDRFDTTRKRPIQFDDEIYLRRFFVR